MTEEGRHMNKKTFIDNLVTFLTIDKVLLVSKDLPEGERYNSYCKALALLASTQLNQEKNKLKPDFEKLSLQNIKTKLNEEVAEFWDELKKGNKKIDFERAFSELGDVAGCLVGFLALLMQIKNEMLK